MGRNGEHIMKQLAFYDKIVDVLRDQSPAHEPEQMAFCIYHLMKENPHNVQRGKAWGTMLRNIKVLLLQHLEWEMSEVFTLLAKLKELTKYMKKTT